MLDIDKLAANIHWLTGFSFAIMLLTIVIGILAIRNAIELNRHKRGE